MIKRRLGKVHRRLRQRARLTQRQLSEKCGVPRWKIGRIEADMIEALRFDEVDRCLEALGAELAVRVNYRGAEVDRLFDELHAQLVARVVELLRRYGWDARVEVTYSEWGERGSYDVLAWHPAERVLLVVEVKSEFVTVEGTLRPLDMKVRLALIVAQKRFGWQARTVGQVLVLPEDRTARRAVARHAEVLRSAMPATSRELRSWLRGPVHSIAAIWFISAPGGRDWPRNPSSVQRVRRPKAPRLTSASSRRDPSSSRRDPALVASGQH